MPLIISDETLKAAGMTEQEAKVEIACRLYDSGKLHLWPAAQFAGLSRTEFEEALIARGLPIYRYTEEDVKLDLATIKHLEERRRAGR